MKYTKAQRLEMLNEIWVEASNGFCEEMAKQEADFKEAKRCREVMESTARLMELINR